MTRDALPRKSPPCYFDGAIQGLIVELSWRHVRFASINLRQFTLPAGLMLLIELEAQKCDAYHNCSRVALRCFTLECAGHISIANTQWTYADAGDGAFSAIHEIKWSNS